VEDLQTQIDDIDVLPAGYSTPSFDSGWIEMQFGGENVVTHGLGTTDVMVQVMMREPDEHIHQKRDYLEKLLRERRQSLLLF